MTTARGGACGRGRGRCRQGQRDTPATILPGDAISFEQELETRAEWAAYTCFANQPISPFPFQSLLLHPVQMLIELPTNT